MSDERPDIRTTLLHGGYRPGRDAGAVTVPIYQTTAYAFEDSRAAAELFALDRIGNIYGRTANPTTEVLERRLAALEGGGAALAVASGKAAIVTSLLTLARAGDNIVSSRTLYGGTFVLFSATLRALGIEVRFVDQDDPSNFERATDDRTRAYYGEPLCNPRLDPFPLRDVAALGRETGVPLIMDNTITPVLCRPLELGAAISLLSCSKYVGGHGTVLGGALVEGGFDWRRHAGRFPALCEPDPAYGGIVWLDAAERLGVPPVTLRARLTTLRDLGPTLSPFSAFQLLQGLETLPLRMREHCRNAEAVAAFLRDHPKVAQVSYPALLDGRRRRLADDMLAQGYGGMVGLELRSGREGATRFVESLSLFVHAANNGDSRSLVIHPAATMQVQLGGEERRANGVPEGYVRLSVGLEGTHDLIADLDRALEKA